MSLRLLHLIFVWRHLRTILAKYETHYNAEDQHPVGERAGTAADDAPTAAASRAVIVAIVCGLPEGSSPSGACCRRSPCGGDVGLEELGRLAGVLLAQVDLGGCTGQAEPDGRGCLAAINDITVISEYDLDALLACARRSRLSPAWRSSRQNVDSDPG